MKTAVITGGNSGIGKATAMGLAKKGYRVIIHGRDAIKTKAAAEEIRKTSGNNNIDFVVADVSTIAGMKELAQRIKQKTTSIEALVLSTGVILSKQIITVDGLETGFVIQYLSRFAVTQLLMQELKAGKAKIVQVGAPAMKHARIYLDDLALKNNFTMLRAMGQEMLANHFFVQEFAKRHPGEEVLINMANVGVASTGIARQFNVVLRMFLSVFGRSAESASRNFVYLASDDKVTFSGYFLGKPGRPAKKEKIQFDPAVSEQLWNKSMALIASIL